jgi:hypothetical protein
MAAGTRIFFMWLHRSVGVGLESRDRSPSQTWSSRTATPTDRVSPYLSPAVDEALALADRLAQEMPSTEEFIREGAEARSGED